MGVVQKEHRDVHCEGVPNSLIVVCAIPVFNSFPNQRFFRASIMCCVMC